MELTEPSPTCMRLVRITDALYTAFNTSMRTVIGWRDDLLVNIIMAEC